VRLQSPAAVGFVVVVRQDMDQQEQPPTNSIIDYGARQIEYGRRLIMTYAWLVGKNLIGWILILASGPTGILLPGPGGLPMFLIGFAMISFPGKRRLTARVLRGKPDRSRERRIQMGNGRDLRPGTARGAHLRVLQPQRPVDAAGPAPVRRREHRERVWDRVHHPGRPVLAAPLAGTDDHQLGTDVRRADPTEGSAVVKAPRVRPTPRAPAATAAFGRWATRARTRPRNPRDRRPTLRTTRPVLEIRQPWVRRAAAVVVTGAIFYWILKPVLAEWPTVRKEILGFDRWRFFVASIMFAAFLAFRAISWRRILIGLGHRLPIAPAVRIWSTSELARYLPGAIWQVVGRVYLIKPYGVSGSVSSTSQVLELTVFMLANVMLATGCYLYYGLKTSDDARVFLYICAAIAPALAIIVHPKVFYGLVNRAMTKLRKPRIEHRLGGWALLRLLGRLLVALLWQNAAVFILVQPVLGLKIDHWWTVTGAYCLAWCVGFAGGFLVPAGIGVREFVFVAGMRVVLPAEVNARLDGPEARALLGFLAILLRLWTVTGELILAGARTYWTTKVR
jgi:uncharacterized membrane protein YbhN (UPF0104 family)